MNLAKEAQFEGREVPRLEDIHHLEDVNHLLGAGDLVVLDDEHPEEEHVHTPQIVVNEPEYELKLDKVPGGIDQDDIVVEEPESIAVEDEDVEVNDDPWSWTTKSFIPWLSKMMKSVPTHSGKDTAGLERAISYLEAVDREISKAVRMDLNNDIAIDSVEKARDEIQNGLERLQDRLDKVKSSKYPKRDKGKKKKGDEEQDGIVKEAQKATHVGGIVVTVPLLISGLARVCINGMVSAGHDIEDMFKKLAKKYDLTAREKFELVQLLQDMNYPVRRDRGLLLDEEFDARSSDNYDYAANYQA